MSASEHAAPAISVVVATRDRAERLPRLVEALSTQHGVGPVEVVLVDDGSRDGTPVVLSELTAPPRVSAAVGTGPFLRTIRLDRSRGPAAARNAGWRASGAPVVAFTDDDCVPQPGWLAALIGCLEARVDLVQGRTVPDPAQSVRRGPFSRTLEVAAETGYYQTCNVAYRRELLDRLGGFDERYPWPAAEDTDLAWRAKETGARTAFATDAVVHHDVRPSSFLVQLRDVRRWESVVRCARRHPGIRDLFHSQRFWRGSHPPALVAGAGAGLAASGAAAGSRVAVVVGAALTLPYFRYRVRVEPLAGGPRRRVIAIPGALVVDLAEVVVLARASLRHRTLLL